MDGAADEDEAAGSIRMSVALPIRRRCRSLLRLLTVVLVVIALGWPGPVTAQVPAPGPTAPSPTGGASSHVPVMAYYYMWFDPNSWNRAKKDYPLLGRYASDDSAVIRQHITWAKSAGIDGFILSWKSSTTNNARLKLLVTIAGEMNFKVAMIYQGLDFHRKPLDPSRVAADFLWFKNNYADNPVLLRLGGKPLTIFSGTWAYNHDDIAAITNPVRDALLVLSSEKNVAGYKRVADVTDGDAYYWSSVNPSTQPNYANKLAAMGEAVHADGNYWLAPFAPGFDARLVGGTKEVNRNNGETLNAEYTAAQASNPDALGLISWNEFSENTHVEPSESLKTQYLTVLRSVLGGTFGVAPQPVTEPEPNNDFADSSTSEGGFADMVRNVALLGAFVILLLGGGTILWVRKRKSPAESLT